MAHAEHRDALTRCVRYLGTALLLAAPPLALVLAMHLGVAGEGAAAMALVSGCVLAAGVLGFLASRRGCLRVFGLAATTVTLAVFGVHLTSFMPLRESFHAELVRQIPNFDAQRWSQLFEEHPALRAIYRASEWRPPPADAG